MNSRVDVLGLGTIIGGSLLLIGAVLIDAGWFFQQPFLGSLGNALSAFAGVGLLCLPPGLIASGIGSRSILARIGSLCLGIGTIIVSLVDVPTIFDPTNLAAGGAFGPIGLVLLSLGFLACFIAIQHTHSLQGWQKWIFLVAGLWFFISFPTIQLPFFVIPNGQPLFVLLAGVFGILQLLMGVVVRNQIARQTPAIA